MNPPDLGARLQPQAKEPKQLPHPLSDAQPEPPVMEHPKSATPRPHFEPSTVFKPYDVLDDTAKAGLVGGASGLFIASIRNALAKTNVGALSVFTRGAPIIGLASMHSTS